MRSLRGLAWTLLTISMWAACQAPGDDDEGVTSGAAAGLDASARYTIVGAASGLCVQISGASTANSARALIQRCNGTTEQVFRVEPAPTAGYFTIRNAASDKCLDVEARSTADGARIIQYTCNGNANQQWAIGDVGGGRKRLTARHSGKVAEVFGSNASGTFLSQRASANRLSQQFVMTAVGSAAGGSGGAGSSGAGAGAGRTGGVAGGSGTGGTGAAGGGTGDTAAGDLGSPTEIQAAMMRANDYFMAKWPDPGADIITDKTRPSHIWTRAVYYEGLMALYELDPQPRFRDYAVRWGESHAFGLNGGATTRNADNQCAGQTYIDLYRQDPIGARVRDIKTSIDAMVNGASSSDWTWIDAIQMSMPVFAKLGVLYGDDAYLERMYAFYSHARNVEGGSGLYNRTDHLWWRDKDFDPPYREPNGEDCYWSRGNGWVYAALTRVLGSIPEDAPHRAEYLADYLAMSEALRAVQRSDGFWNVSLHDPTNHGGRELSGTALFTYGMAWGVRTGVLDAASYRPVLAKAWTGMVRDALHADGALGYVQSTGKQPSDGQPVSYDKMPNFEDFGLGAFLLAGSEVSKLAKR